MINFLEGKIYCFYELTMLVGNCDLIAPNVKIKYVNIIIDSFSFHTVWSYAKFSKMFS